MPDTYDGPDPDRLPDHHPLADYDDDLSTHADHLDALAEYLASVDPEQAHSVMLLVTTADPAATETVPTMHESAPFDDMVWYQLAAHISHVAHAFDAPPASVAKHAVHVLEDQQGGESA
jgi:hypothetical protein